MDTQRGASSVSGGSLFVSAAMSSGQSLRDFISKRLTAAAEEILREFEKTIARYEEEIVRQRRLLDTSWRTQSPRNSAVLSEHHGSTDEDLRDKDTNVKQEEPQIKDEVEELCISQDEELPDLKEETHSFMIPPYEDDRCFDDYLNIHQVITSFTATSVPEELTPPADAETLAEKEDGHDKSQASKTVSLSGSQSYSDSEKLKKSFKKKSQKIPEGGRFPCKVCSKSFRTAAILVAHMRIHTGEKPFSCNVCGKSFTACGTLANHMIIHVNKRPFSCSLCDKSFKQRRHLNVHMRVHSGEKPYACEECGLSYKSNSALKSHRRVHAAETDPESTDQGADATGSPDACEKPFKETQKDKRYTCEQCGKSFSQDLGLMRHVRLHTDERPFVCKVCGKTFKQSVSLKNHTRIHTGEKPFSCKVCGRSFTLGSTLIRHMKVHTGERPFLCKVCGKTFVKRDHLQGHMRIHTGETPFTCQVCGKSFKLSVNLKSHLRIHTGERPFSCEVCGRRFVQNSQLKVHMRMHVTTPDEPFACQECGQTFGQRSKLKRHTAAHSGQKSIACEECGETFGSTLTFNDHMKIHASEDAYSRQSQSVNTEQC